MQKNWWSSIGRCGKNGNYFKEDLANLAYEPNMELKYLFLVTYQKNQIYSNLTIF